MTGRAAILLTVLGSATALLSSIATERLPLLIWNASASVPIGLYRLRSFGRPAVADLVAVWPPEPLATFLENGRYLPRGIPMLKRVAALPGQTVCRNGLAITIDEIWMGEARERDRRGHALPIWQGCRVVADREVFLMNWQSGDSLDGRYFGVLPMSAIIGQAQPLWTRGEE